MFLAVRESAADPYDENGTVSSSRLGLALGRCPMRELPEQLFGLDENDLLWQDRRNVAVCFVYPPFLTADHTVNSANDPLEEFEIAVFCADCPFPIPLIDINRMDVVQLLVGPNRIHVGVKAEAGRNAVSPELYPFPLGQRVYDLYVGSAQGRHRKSYGPFGPVQVVVDARPRADEKGCRHPTQVELFGEHRLERIFDLFDGLFHHFGH